MRERLESLSRRGVLKLGTMAGVFAIGGTALLTQSDEAVAASFTISDAAPETTDDGSLNYVRLQATHQIEWDGFDTDVAKLRYVDSVTVRPNDENQTDVVYNEVSANLDDWSGQGDSNGFGGDDEHTSGVGKAGYAHSGIDWNILGDPNATDPEDGGPRSVEEPSTLIDLLEEDTDGETKTSTVVFEKEVRLLDADGNRLGTDVASDSFVVEVTNEEATTDSFGSGDTSAEGDDEEP